MKLKTDITESDHKELGLKCGLEIHQQLEGKKLFCNCPTVIRDDTPDFEIIRNLRASAGESGDVDAAALAETKKEKYFLYEGYDDTTCLVEQDEEPPGEVNSAALRSAIQVAKLLNMNIVDQLRFMRKTVVNGSNTSGFQRTGLVATQGMLRTGKGKFCGVESLGLEEDSCKDIEKTTDYTKYNLSRLGIPLLELATAPDISTPDEAKDVAEYIGMIMRSLPNVKRGLGTIRQDVNISIAKGVRVEIKGAQDLKMIPTILRNEMLRQHNLLDIFEELNKRGATVGKDIIDVTSLFTSSTSKVITTALAKDTGVVLALPLYSFGGLTKLETQPGRRYGSELSDYAKVMGVAGLFHADELPNYGITQAEKDNVFAELKLDATKDNFLLIADTTDVAQRALSNAQDRAADFTLRKEVRTAKPDGTSVFMRPMPGASRMYPETDVKPIVIDADAVKIPELLSEKIGKLVKQFGIAEDIAKRLLKDGIDLPALTKKYPNLKAAFIIDTYYSLPSMIKKKQGVDVDIISHADTLFAKLNDNKITKDSFEELLALLSQGKEVDWSTYELVDIADITDDVKAIIVEMKGAPMGAIIGKVMNKYKGRVDGKELAKLVAQLHK
ncbi:Glu-tRNA(Gln) amidotransferase subunit GatE [Candidatus Woesearchaeota archaeon]|nr:Glu-tRNA(Gln) amidotransferase subunit GatE [Candidatus Woesearchaeota archaeon]